MVEGTQGPVVMITWGWWCVLWELAVPEQKDPVAYTRTWYNARCYRDSTGMVMYDSKRAWHLQVTAIWDTAWNQ